MPAQPYRELLEHHQEKNFTITSLGSLQHQWWYKKLCLFYKIFKENKPVYHFNLIPTKNVNYNTRRYFFKEKKIFLKFRKIYRKTPVLKYLFNKVTDT